MTYGQEQEQWTPCYAINFGEEFLWVCRPRGPQNPAEEDFMRSISS